MSQEESLKNTIYLALLSVILFCSLVHAVDGIAVTNRQTIGFTNYGAHGNIWRFDIKDNEVVKSTKLYEGKAHWTMINPAGTHIAFLHQKDGKDYIAIIPIDGGAVKDLRSIPSGKGMCTWDKNNNIYFSIAERGKEIYKIKMDGTGYGKAGNVNSGGSDARCWDLNVTADRSIAQKSGGGLTIASFPSGSGASDPNAGTCNPAISPSGAYVSGINTSGHIYTNIMPWKGEKEELVRLYNDSMCIWGGYPQELHGMDKSNWSCNSDKWLCVRLGWPGQMGGRFGKQGSNQVITNWIDNIVIRTTLENTQAVNEGDTKYFSEAGDFWVAGLNGRIELVSDKTSVRENAQPAFAQHAISIHSSGSYVTVASAKSARYNISIINSKGRHIFSKSGYSAIARIPSSQLLPGTYFVKARFGMQTANSQITISR